MKDWKQASPERAKEIHFKNVLKTKYGITLDRYNAMLEEQNNACAICEQPFKIKACVDHCHRTGRVRGLLCTRCNTSLPLVENHLARALAYTERGD